MQAINHFTNVSQMQKVWALRAAGAVGAVALLVYAAPYVWTAVATGMGLAALGAMGVAGVVVFQSIPLGMQKLENHLLLLRKAEARRNPIEQLQNEVLRRAERLRAFRQALVTVGGQIESIRQMIENSQTKFTGPVLARQERALAKLQQFHSLNIARLNQAQAALQEFKNTVEQKQSEWQIALAIDDANRALDPNAADHLIQDLLADTALRTVQDRFNNVFAELDVQMSSLDSPTRSLLHQDERDQLGDLQLSSINVRGGSL
jgi:hypothetical protein